MLIIDIAQQDGSIIAVTKKKGIEQHLKELNTKLYRDAGLPPFGDTDLGCQLGTFVSSSIATQIFEGSSIHEDKSISAITAQLQRRTDITPMPPPPVT
jgi:hypothetical protein